MAQAVKKVKIDIIAGFLGAGKTTFILNLLKGNPGERVVICENEFGKASIDAAVLRGKDYEVFELREGCICCTLAAELAEGLQKVIDSFRPDRVLIEPTGLARLGDVLDALRAQNIADLVEVDARVLLIDGVRLAKHFEKFLHHFGEALADASAVFVTKTEDYTRDQREAALAALHAAYPALDAGLLPDGGDLWTRIHKTRNLDAGQHALRASAESAAESTEGYTALSIGTRYAGSKEKCEALLAATGKWGDIVRAKGTVYDGESRPYRLDYAADTLTVVPAESDGVDEVQFIGVGLNATAIRSKLGKLSGKRKAGD